MVPIEIVAPLRPVALWARLPLPLNVVCLGKGGVLTPAVAEHAPIGREELLTPRRDVGAGDLRVVNEIVFAGGMLVECWKGQGSRS